MSFLERNKKTRVLISAILLALTAISAWHEVFPQGVPPLAVSDVENFRPPFISLAVDSEKYFDSADCSQHNVVPRIVPCSNDPNSLKLLPDATRYAITQYLAHIAKTPAWAVVTAWVLELVSIMFFMSLIFAILTDRIKNVPEIIHIVLAPFAFALIVCVFYWYLTYKAPISIYRSIKNGTVVSDLREIRWSGFFNALLCSLLFLAVFGILIRFELLAIVMSFILGFVIAAIGWGIAPYLPEELGRAIIKTRPDLLWIGASSVAGVTATFMDVYVWLVGFFGIYAILLALTLLSFVPAIVWVAFDRFKSIADIAEKMFHRGP